MCCCYRRPCTWCCECVWRHCKPCAKHVFPIRIILVTLSIIDIFVMIYFMYATLTTSLQSCCGIVHYPKPEINDNSMNAYSECVQLNYENIILSDYSNFIFNSKHYHTINWNAFGSIFTYYDINVTVSPITNGCIVNNYDCFNDTVKPCINSEYINNQSYAAKINEELQNMCDQSMSDMAQLYAIAGILGIAVIKILLIIVSICSRLCRNEFRPQNEAIHNILHPTYCPELIEKQKNDAYDRMTDESEHKYKVLWGFWNCIKYSFLFFVLLLRMFWFMLRKSYLLIFYMTNFACSMALFLLHNSPVLGVDGTDFCVHGANDFNVETCNVAEDECGIVDWIIMPDISQYLIPRYMTLTVAWLAFLGRLIEKFAVCKLQDMIVRKDSDIIKHLHVDQKELEQFMKLSVND